MNRLIKITAHSIAALTLIALPVASTGCESLPGGKKEQGAVIGGAGGAAAGAVIGGDENRVEGALIGGALGAVGGWLVGSSQDKDDDVEGARAAATEAQNDPATAAEARTAASADINNDGFVTLDEVVALENSGLADAVIIDRLRETGHVFNLTPSQEDYLLDRGVSFQVVSAMRDMNEAYTRDGANNEGDAVISG